MLSGRKVAPSLAAGGWVLYPDEDDTPVVPSDHNHHECTFHGLPLSPGLISAVAPAEAGKQKKGYWGPSE